MLHRVDHFYPRLRFKINGRSRLSSRPYVVIMVFGEWSEIVNIYDTIIVFRLAYHCSVVGHLM